MNEQHFLAAKGETPMKTLNIGEIAVGMRIVGIDPHGPDTEAGIVLDLDPAGASGHQVLIGWEQGTQSWSDAAALVRQADYDNEPEPARKGS